VLTRLAMLGNPLENRGEKTLQRFNEAIDIQSDLARRYPEVPLYPIALVQYHLQQSEIYYALRRFEKARESMGKASQIADSLQNNGVAPLLVKTFMDRIRERLSILEEKTKE
jgi:tetratricopeptide (TPR) repeat protein